MSIRVPKQNRIRWGIWALPLSGLLSTTSALIPGVAIDPSTNPDGFAQVSANVGLGNLLGILAVALLLIGVFALFLFLSGTQVERVAFAAILLILIGTVFFLPFLGIYTFTAPVVGRRYLNGDKTAVSTIVESTSITNPSALVFGGVAVFLLVLGGTLFGTAVWRSKSLPKWSGLLLAIGIPLWADPLFYYQPIIWLAGSLLITFSGIWMSYKVRSQGAIAEARLPSIGNVNPSSSK